MAIVRLDDLIHWKSNKSNMYPWINPQLSIDSHAILKVLVRISDTNDFFPTRTPFQSARNPLWISFATFQNKRRKLLKIGGKHYERVFYKLLKIECKQYARVLEKNWVQCPPPPEFVTDVTYFEVVEAGGCETVGSIHQEITQALNDLDSWNISTDQDIKVGYW